MPTRKKKVVVLVTTKWKELSESTPRIPILLETIKNLEDLCPYRGKVVTNDQFAAYLEKILKEKNSDAATIIEEVGVEKFKQRLLPGIK